MAILLIDKIKQKNNGTFKLMDAIDINWEGFDIPVDNVDAYTKAETDQRINAAKYNDSEVKASIASNKSAIDILNGTGDGSVDKKVADAVAGILDGAPEAYDTLKEISTWISTHGKDAATMNTQIETNKSDIAKLVALVGSLPAGIQAKTIVEYIDSKVGAIDYSEAIATAKQEAITAAAGDATTKATAAETNAKKYADSLAKNYATAAQGTKADSALQNTDIIEGATNGTISVKGEDVAVHGLGSAAYAETSAFDGSGSATQALKDAKAYTDQKVGEVDLSGIETNATAISGLKDRVSATETDIATIKGTGAGSISKAVSDAKTELQTKITSNKSAIDTLNGDEKTAGSVKKQVADAKSSLQNQITSNKEIIDKLNGEASVTGSVKQQIAAAKTDLEGKINSSKYDDTAIKERVAATESDITTLKGADTVEGSVAKTVKDAVSVLEKGQVTTNKTDIATLKSNKADKASTLAGYGIGDAYTKTETDSKISTAVANAEHLKRAIVTALPDIADADEHTIYMVPKASGDKGTGAQNGYNEYMLIVTGNTKKFEIIGDSAVDLTDYATKAYADQSETDAISAAKTYSDGLAKNYATAAQGKKADTAVQSIVSGTSNGTISVDGTDVTVKGINGAAYKAENYYEVAGVAQTKVNELASGQVATNKTDIANLTTRVTSLEGTTFVEITETEIENMFK